MAYQKRRSTIVEKALARLRGLQSTDPSLDLGNGLTLQDYAALIKLSIDQLEAHNLALAEADRTRIEFSEVEASVSNFSSRILSAVSAMYGRDSKEYEMAGGKPPSRTKRSKKISVTTGSSEPQSQTISTNTTSLNGSATNGAGQVMPLS
jgi:hypothetical protein